MLASSVAAEAASQRRWSQCWLLVGLLSVSACDSSDKLVERTPEAMAAHLRAGELPRHDGPAKPVAIADLPAGGLSVGRIVAIDRTGGRLTLQHDPGSPGDWPVLTITAAVRPPSLLDRVKVGDRAQFHLEYRADTPEVVAIEPYVAHAGTAPTSAAQR
jgi:Cu/Ag efflux protein CusF